MADGIDDEEGEEGEGEEKVGGKRKLLFVLLAVLLLSGVGAGLYFGGVFDSGGEGGEAHGEEDAHGGAHAVDAHGVPVDENGDPLGPVYYELPEFLVNLSSTGKKVSFLKMKVTLELENELAVAKVDAKKPRIQDAVNTYLRELRTSDLAGSAGIYRLREELLLRINKSIHPEQVTDVLFSEIIVQ